MELRGSTSFPRRPERWALFIFLTIPLMSLDEREKSLKVYESKMN